MFKFYILAVILCTVSADFIFRDLYSNQDEFIAYPDHWASSGAVHSTSCTQLMLGLFGEGSSLTFVHWTIPEHNTIDFRVKVLYIEAWDGESLQFDISNKTHKTTLFSGNVTAGNSGTTSCGDPIKTDGVSTIYGSVSHTGSYLSIRFSSPRLIGKAANWGISEFSITARNASNSPDNSICNTGSPSLTITGTCQCPDGQYRSSNGDCAPCHEACTSCYGPEATHCFACNSWHSDYAKCQCPAPRRLVQNHCYLDCDDGKFLDRDQCVDSCPPIRSLEVGKECRRNCGDQVYANQYGGCAGSCTPDSWVIDKDCVDSCPSYMYQIDATDVQGYCVLACPSPKVRSGDKCIDSCPSPKLASNGECVDTCPSEQFAYNGTCVSYCPFPKVQVLDLCLNFCPFGMTTADHPKKEYAKRCLNSTGGLTPEPGTCIPPKFRHQGQCYDSCPDGFTADTGTYTCFCNTPPKFSYQNKCLDSCPPGLSPDYSSFSYYTCKCFSPKYSHEGQCLDECPPGTTPDTSFSSTYTCKADSGTTCSPPKVYYNGQCLDTCPTGTTPDISSTPHSCTTSSGSTCNPPKFSYQDQCLDSCPTGTKTNTNSYTCQDFILRDLYSDSFINYPYNWDSPQVHTLDDTCGSEKLIGGSLFSTGQYVDFVYTDLPDHTVIQFRVKVWFIDTWNGDTVLFDVLSNTKKVTLSPGNMKSVSSGTNVCGGSSKPDGSAIIHGNIDHTGSYLLIRMYSSLYNIGPSITGTSTFSWGIREFSVVARTSAQSYSGDSCNIANPLNLALNGSCTCPNGQYPISNGGCGTCHAACSSCYGPGSTDCFTCNPSHANYAECMCPSPLKLSEGKCIQACPTGQLDYQGQCVGTCPATTVASNGQCVSSCSSSQVSYQGQCLAKCPSSKLAYKGGCVDFCPSGTYEYEGTCVISCPYFTVKVQNKCANSCPSPKVAYIDTCVDSCPKGFLNKDRCVAQCPPTKVQVLTYCVNSCPDGMTADSSKICLNSNGGATPLDGTCAPPKFFYKNQCLNSCPSQTSADYDAYTCQGDFILRDLYSNPLISYPENWVSPQFETLPTTECGSGNSLIGGYNKFGEGAYLDFIYFNLPVHTRIEFRAKIWYIDAWNKNYVQFIVSSEVSTTETSKVTVFPGKMTAVSGGTNVCGSTTSSDGYAIIYGSVAHTGSYLSIRAVSNVYSPATSLSWGIREFSVVSRTPPTPYSGNTCNIANPPSLAISTSASCTCPDGQYKTSSGTCSPCHEACLSCYGSAATQCFTCNPSYPGYEECMCPAPLKLSQGKCVLTCPAGKFVHNGQCVSSCPERYISSGDQCVRNCTYPQLFEETILSYVCKDKCVSPKLEYNRECVDFCPSHTYRNEGKCVLACPFPKVKSGFGTDGKCVDACPPSKFTSVDECVDTCPQGEFPYNGKCMSHCSPPKVQLLKTCIDSCPPQMTFLSHPEVPGAGYCMNSTGGGNPCPAGVTVDPTTYTCSCPAPKFSYQGQCLDSCPTGTTSDTTTTPYTCKTSSGSTCSPPKFSHQGQCLDTCPTGTTSDTTTTPYTCKTCPPPKFFHQSQCLDTCPTGTTPDTTTTPYTCKTGSGSTCSPPKFSHQGQCLDNCPTGTTADTTAYTCTAASSDCIPNCAVCDGQKCKICKTGFKKFDDTTCYPVCPAGKKLTSAGVCEEPTYQYQTPSCIDKLKQGLDDQTCKLSNGLQAVYEVTYNPSTHYFSQKQDGVTMTCSDNQQTRKLSASGSYLATLTMIAKRAGVSTLNGFSLTSTQDIGTSISPLVTDRCDFAPVLPTKLTGFPFYLLGVFPLMTQGADFSTIAAAQLSQIYSKTLVDRAIGNLVACGQSCSAILVWKHTNANKPISSHATMLVKLTTTTAAGTMDQIFKNAQVAFADPAANNSAKREKSTLCYDEGGLRYCASELIIYKKKSA